MKKSVKYNYYNIRNCVLIYFNHDSMLSTCRYIAYCMCNKGSLGGESNIKKAS